MKHFVEYVSLGLVLKMFFSCPFLKLLLISILNTSDVFFTSIFRKLLHGWILITSLTYISTQ